MSEKSVYEVFLQEDLKNITKIIRETKVEDVEQIILHGYKILAHCERLRESKNHFKEKYKELKKEIKELKK